MGSLALDAVLLHDFACARAKRSSRWELLPDLDPRGDVAVDVRREAGDHRRQQEARMSDVSSLPSVR